MVSAARKNFISAGAFRVWNFTGRSLESENGAVTPAVHVRYTLSRRFTSMERRTVLSAVGVALLVLVPGVVSAKDETVTIEVTGMS